jgi:ABC-2 type transport system ATP-binding protein
MQLMDLLRRWADEGRAVLFSSHILEEVEQLAGEVVVIVGGKLAALGGISGIRAAMLDRPHHVRIRASDPRRLAAALVQEPKVSGVSLHGDGALTVQASELGACALAIPRVARDYGIRLLEVAPEDESLESVFAYLVGRS